jgi:predicted transcriptional regulator of viral defense system
MAVSDPHRTVLDMLARPDVGGGIRHVQTCLSAYLASPEGNLTKLVEYGDRLGVGAVFKRLGFLLEGAEGAEAALEACRKRLTKGNAKLDPGQSSRRLITRWRLWVPERWVGRTRD